MATAAIQAAKTISIHALREESDPQAHVSYQDHFVFQSTLSARRATEISSITQVINNYFNPRSPRGERREFISIDTRY